VLPAEKYGGTAARFAGADRPLLLKARHFLQEDFPGPIAEVVASLVAEA
jgi:hypothetical protein